MHTHISAFFKVISSIEFRVEKNYEIGQTKEELKLKFLIEHCRSVRHAQYERLFTNLFILVEEGRSGVTNVLDENMTLTVNCASC